MATSVYDRDLSLQHVRTFRWSAVIAGFFVAIGCQVILTAIGAALGISAASIGGPGDASQGLGIAAGIWMVISPILSLFLGGLAASYVARPFTKGAGGFHGVMVWCLATVFGLYMLSSFAGLLGRSVTGVAGLGAQVGSGAASNEQLDAQSVREEFDQQREQLRAEFEQNREQIAQTGEKAADVGTGVAWASVLGLLLSLGAAAIGGRSGVPDVIHDDDDTPRRRIVRADETEVRPDLH